MDKLRIIFIILTAIWMIVVFCFSNEPANKSGKTSSAVTKAVAKTIYSKTPEKIDKKVEQWDPIIRKIAHYTLYLVRWFTNFRSNIYT